MNRSRTRHKTTSHSPIPRGFKTVTPPSARRRAARATRHRDSSSSRSPSPCCGRFAAGPERMAAEPAICEITERFEQLVAAERLLPVAVAAAVRTNQVDDQLIRQRKDAFRSYQALTPPRVLTSGRRGCRRIIPTRRFAGRRAGQLTGFRRDRRGAGPRHLGHGGGRSRSGRHPGHRLHGPQFGRPCS
jgi:hypothetical protein